MDTLATEQTTELESKPAAPPILEEQTANEPMRHVPSLHWLCEKLDGDIRRRLEKLSMSIESHPTHEADNELRALSRAFDRLADTAKHIRNNGHGPSDALHKVRWSLNHALSCLRLVDPVMFGRRAPFHHFDRSKSELLYAAFLVALCHVDRLTTVVRVLDPSIDERLFEGLVNLMEPLREQPIA
jgi:hypothetical protein